MIPSHPAICAMCLVMLHTPLNNAHTQLLSRAIAASSTLHSKSSSKGFKAVVNCCNIAHTATTLNQRDCCLWQLVLCDCAGQLHDRLYQHICRTGHVCVVGREATNAFARSYLTWIVCRQYLDVYQTMQGTVQQALRPPPQSDNIKYILKTARQLTQMVWERPIGLLMLLIAGSQGACICLKQV